jgi:hypothetical protein
MAASLSRYQQLIRTIKWPDHWISFKDLDMTCPSGYVRIKPRGHFKTYRNNRGIIDDINKYHHIYKNMFVILMEYVARGEKIEIPFFGELFIEETKQYNSPNGYKAGKNKKKHQLVFNSINYNSFPMSKYIVFFPVLTRSSQYVLGKKIKARQRYVGNSLIYNVLKSKRIYGTRYFKQVK